MHMKPINLISSSSSPPFTLPLPICTPTVPVLQSCLSILNPNSMFKGVFQCMPAVNMHYFGQFNSLCYSLLPLHSYSALICQLSVHIIMYPTYTAVKYFNVVDSLSFSFPSELR
jgi:hypothetical protein